MPNSIKTSDDILGKEVVNSEGSIIGIVQKIHINMRSKEIVGITVDEGFMKPDLYIGIENVRLFGVDAIFLNTTSDAKFKGIAVFTKDGAQIGTVTDIVRKGKSGKIKEIKIKKGMTLETIPAKDIKSIGANVLLK